MENLRLIFSLYRRPLEAMSEIIDHGSWFSAFLIALIVSAAFSFSVNKPLDAVYSKLSPMIIDEFLDDDADNRPAREQFSEAIAKYRERLEKQEKIPVVGDAFFRFFDFSPSSFFRAPIGLIAFFVPFSLFVIGLTNRRVPVGVVFRRDFGALLLCALAAWSAGHFPFAVIGHAMSYFVVPPAAYLGLWVASSLLFGAFMIAALRVACGAGFVQALVTVSFAWLSLAAGTYVFAIISPLLFSPIILLVLLMYFGGALAGEGGALKSRQDFKRFLHNATVNPRDADAHVQLALIYLQRRQEEKAITHLETAISIDENEIDANYELGRIARRSGELQKALDYFVVVLEQNDKFRLSEIWREIGVTYFDAAMYGEAREALEKFVERRNADPEGLYYLGLVCKKLGEAQKAAEYFNEAVESVKASPDFRARELREWKKLAERELGN